MTPTNEQKAEAKKIAEKLGYKEVYINDKGHYFQHKGDCKVSVNGDLKNMALVYSTKQTVAPAKAEGDGIGDDAPEGDEPSMAWKKAELTAYMDEQGIPYETDDNKTDLLRKIEESEKESEPKDQDKTEDTPGDDTPEDNAESPEKKEDNK